MIYDPEKRRQAIKTRSPCILCLSGLSCSGPTPCSGYNPGPGTSSTKPGRTESGPGQAQASGNKQQASARHVTAPGTVYQTSGRTRPGQNHVQVRPTLQPLARDKLGNCPSWTKSQASSLADPSWAQAKFRTQTPSYWLLPVMVPHRAPYTQRQKAPRTNTPHHTRTFPNAKRVT